MNLGQLLGLAKDKRENTASLYDELPYRTYKDGIFYNSDTVGFAKEIAILAGANEEIIDTLNSLIKETFYDNDNFVYNFTMLNSMKVGYRLDRNISKKTNSDNVLREIAKNQYNYSVESAQGHFRNNQMSKRLSLRDYRSFFSVCTDKVKDVDKLEDLKQFMDAKLGSNMPTNDLDEHSLLSYVREVFNPKFNTVKLESFEYNQYEYLNRQINDFDTSYTVSEDNSYIDITTYNGYANDKNEIRAVPLVVDNLPTYMTLSELPNAIASWTKSNELNIIDNPFLFSVNFRVNSRQGSEVMVSRKKSNMEKTSQGQLVDKLFTRKSMSEEIQEWTRLENSLKDNEIKLADVQITFVLFTDEKNHLMDVDNAIKNFKNVGISLRRNTYWALQSYLECLPFVCTPKMLRDSKTHKRTKVLTSMNVANLLPICMDWKGLDSGLLLPTFRNQLFFLDPYRMGDNYNLNISGMSGKGKSFFVIALLTMVLQEQGQAWVIDKGESFKNACDIFGGSYISVDQIGLNPFTFIKQWEGEDGQSNSVVNFLQVLLSRTKLDDKLMPYLRDAANYAWNKNKNKANMDDVYDGLMIQYEEHDKDRRIYDMAQIIKGYKTDSVNAPRIFNEPSQIDPDQQLTVLEMGGFDESTDENIKRAVFYSLITNIENIMYLKDKSRKKMVIIDEAWELLGDDDSQGALFIKRLFKTARKFTGSAVTLVQHISEYLDGGPAAKAAYDNASIKVHFGPDPDSFSSFNNKHAGTFKPYEIDMLKKFVNSKDAGYSEMYVSAGGAKSFNRLFVDPFSNILFSSHGQHKAMVSQLMDEGKTLLEAVNLTADYFFGDTHGNA